jgi:hypothetical protein
MLSGILLLSLILWGGYVTFVFLGVRPHSLALLGPDQYPLVAKEGQSDFITGLAAALPAFVKFLRDATPFLPYVVVSVLIYGALVWRSIFVKGRLYLDIAMRPVSLLLLFLFSVWLLFSTVPFYRVGSEDPRFIVAPSAAAYPNASGETLSALQEHFDHLNNRGCLALQPQIRGPGNADVYRMAMSCIQTSFVTRVLGPIVVILFLLFSALVLGGLFLKLLRLDIENNLTEYLTCQVLGLGLLIALLWMLALFGIFNAAFTWVLLTVIPLAGFRASSSWLKKFVSLRWSYRRGFFDPAHLLFWLLLTLLAFNYLTVIRPFPIGWDDLGTYINNARLISSYGRIIPSMFRFQWEYLTALGFVLFGYNSTFGATVALEINWMAGLLAVLCIATFLKVFLGPKTGLLAALFYYALPMVGHFSFADMKTENAIFTFGATSVLLVFLAVCEKENGKEKNRNPWQLFVLAGILGGFAMAMKLTAVFSIVMGGLVMAAATLRWWGFGAVAMAAVFVFLRYGFPVGKIMEIIVGNAPPTYVATIMSVLPLLFAALFLSCGVRREGGTILKKSLQHIALFAVGGVLSSLPWTAHNAMLAKSLSLGSLINGADRITPVISYRTEDLPSTPPAGGMRALPPELALDEKHPACASTARQEELDRYWGYGGGIMHFFGLPWRVVMNLDSYGYYLITSPLLLLLPLLLLYPFTWRQKWLLWLLMGTFFLAFSWIFIGNGVPWYGITIFLGLAAAVECLTHAAPTRTLKVVAGALVAIALFSSIALRIAQFRLQMGLYEYAWGKATARTIQENTIPDYDDIVREVMRQTEGRPDRPYLYRVGTFIKYFIPQNIELIAAQDHQLSLFSCLNQERDHQFTLKRLQALGFHSMIIDTNTTTIEKDPQGTLHQKFNQLVDFLNDPQIPIRPVVNNPERGVVYAVLP